MHIRQATHVVGNLDCFRLSEEDLLDQYMNFLKAFDLLVQRSSRRVVARRPAPTGAMRVLVSRSVPL